MVLQKLEVFVERIWSTFALPIHVRYTRIVSKAGCDITMTLTWAYPVVVVTLIGAVSSVIGSCSGAGFIQGNDRPKMAYTLRLLKTAKESFLTEWNAFKTKDYLVAFSDNISGVTSQVFAAYVI